MKSKIELVTGLFMEPTQLTNLHSFITSEDFENAYSLAEYKSCSERVKKCTLQFLLALNQPANHIVEHARKNVIKLFSNDDKFYDLTPLMVAVLKADKESVKGFLTIAKEKGLLENILNSEDRFKWCAIHFAAVVSSEILEIFKSFGVSKVKARGLTVEGIQIAKGEIDFAISAQHTFLSVNQVSKKRFSDLSQSELERFAGLRQYTDTIIYGNQHWKTIWQEVKKEIVSCISPQEWIVLWDKWKKNPPKLLVTDCEEIKKNGLNHFLELRSLEKIKAGTFICPNGGSFFVPEKGDVFNNLLDMYNASREGKQSYRVRNSNSIHIGNAARYVNHGFPNAGFTNIIINGLDQVVLYALDDIEADSPILICHQTDSQLSFGKSCILGKNDLDNFFKYGLNPKITQYLKLKNSSRTELILKERLTFPLKSPVTLLYLHLNGFVPIADWYKYKTDPTNPIGDFFKININNFYYCYLKSALKRIFEFEEFMKAHEDLRLEVSNWILNSIGHLTAFEIFKGMDLIKTHFSTANQKAKEINLKIILADLDKYRWETDDTGPFGKTRLGNDYYEEILEHCSNMEEAISKLRITLKTYVKESDIYGWALYALNKINIYCLGEN